MALPEIDLNLVEEMKNPDFANGFIAAQDRCMAALVTRLTIANTALEYIKALAPTPILDTGFNVGPQALLDAAQREAKSALKKMAKVTA